MKKKTRNILLVAILIITLPVAYFGYSYYQLLYRSNVKVDEKSARYLYIPTGSDFNALVDSLSTAKVLISKDRFIKAAKQKNFTNVRPGRYKLKSGMSNGKLIRIFSIGDQAPVRLTLAGNIRTKEKLAGIVSNYLECDSVELCAFFYNNDQLAEYGLNANNVLGICILDTYEFYWNTSPKGFIERMVKESNRFWNADREAKRQQTSWSRMEIITIASIVAEETIKTDEMPKIAGVYINRLKSGMLLQADPTVKYAVNDFTIKRVLDRHTAVDSPYNTYKYAGLPPGPICIPSTAAIDAVLNAEKHDYYYFCAKSDFSGYHAFAKTLAQHNQNAQAYQAALNKNRIYR